MITWLKKLFASDPPIDYKAMVDAGAQVIDVRSKGEYAGGHVPGSLNVPLQDLQLQLGKIKKSRTVIVCCASGARSAQAKQILNQRGYNDVVNAGSWMALRKKIVG
jgi:phage shock protein E